MNRLLTLLAILSLAVLSGCGGGAPSTDELSVSIEIDVPPGAGVEADDVSFEALSPDDYDGDIGEAIAGFELLPDGARFEEPVRVTLTAVNPPDGALTFVHESADGVEGLNVVSTDFDAETQTLTVVAEVTHFSRVWFNGGGKWFNATPQYPETVVVGVPFSVTVQVQQNEEHPWPWRIFEGKYTSFGPVDPNTVEDRPPSTLLDVRTFSIPQTFTCRLPSTIDIWYNASIDYHLFEDRANDDPGNPEWSTWVWLKVDGIRCLAPTPTPTPSNTPVPPTPTKDPLQEFGEIFLQTPTPTPRPTQVVGDPRPLDLGPGTIVETVKVDEGWMVVFVLDGQWFHGSGLRVAQPDACDYIHVHGGPITPVNSETFFFKSEHLGECGFGPPNFLMVPIPR